MYTSKQPMTIIKGTLTLDESWSSSRSSESSATTIGLLDDVVEVVDNWIADPEMLLTLVKRLLLVVTIFGSSFSDAF